MVSNILAEVLLFVLVLGGPIGCFIKHEVAVHRTATKFKVYEKKLIELNKEQTGLAEHYGKEAM